MKIWNLKINLAKMIGILSIFILLWLMIYLIQKHTSIQMTTQNFSTILRDSHQDISRYLNRKITTSGYIFRGEHFNQNNFVIARDMLISETETNIVGFLCSYEQANEFENNEWVEATGIITLGDYYGPIPLLQITEIHRITTPNDVFVGPPK